MTAATALAAARANALLKADATAPGVSEAERTIAAAVSAARDAAVAERKYPVPAGAPASSSSSSSTAAAAAVTSSASSHLPPKRSYDSAGCGLGALAICFCDVGVCSSSSTPALICSANHGGLGLG